MNSSLLRKRAFIDSLSFHFQYIKNQAHDIGASYDLCFALPNTDLRVSSNVKEVDPSIKTALINAIGRLEENLAS